MKERVIELITEVLDVPEGTVTETSGRDSVAGWDSSAELNLGLALEEAFEIQLQPEELMGLQSVEQILGILAAHQVDAA
jgi:acyl carrier protein